MKDPRVSRIKYWLNEYILYVLIIAFGVATVLLSIFAESDYGKSIGIICGLLTVGLTYGQIKNVKFEEESELTMTEKEAVEKSGENEFITEPLYCPFCRYKTAENRLKRFKKQYVSWVQCLKCSASGPKISGEDKFKVQVKATNGWNRRW